MKLFISYRRRNWPFVHLLSEKLEKSLQMEVFVDYTGIDEADFENSILRHLRQSNIVLAVVTQDTFDPKRIHASNDWVRREIALALSLKKPIILVCVDNLLPPSATTLPEDIRAVTRMQAIPFYSDYFDAAIQKLAEFVEKVLASTVAPPMTMGRWTMFCTLGSHLEPLAVCDISFSRNGQFLASGMRDGVIRIWNTTNQQLLHTLVGDSTKRSISSIDFSPDGRFLASTGFSFVPVKIWNPHSGQLLHTLPMHEDEGGFNNVTFAPRGQYLASGGVGLLFTQKGKEERIKIWNPQNGQLLRSLVGLDTCCSLAFSPDGQLLVCGDANDMVSIWNPQNGHLLHTLSGHSDAVKSIAFSPDGRLLASGSLDGTIRVWDVLTMQLRYTLVREKFVDERHPVYSVIFSPDGQLLATCGGIDKEIQLWSAQSGQLLFTLTGHASFIEKILFSPDGKLLASGGGDGIILWSNQ